MSLACVDLPPPSLPTVPNARLHACRFSWQDAPVAFATSAPSYPGPALLLPPGLRQAVPKRQAEYLAGRYCARRAEHALNGQCSHIATGPDRAPVWPAGLAGSISHVEGYALAIVCASHQERGVGIDVEMLDDSPEPAGMHAQVANAAEFACLSGHVDDCHAFRLMFSAKEAIYKALYPRTRRFIDFHEARCVAADGQFLWFLASEALAPNLPLQVAYTLRDGLVFTLCALAPTG